MGRNGYVSCSLPPRIAYASDIRIEQIPTASSTLAAPQVHVFDIGANKHEPMCEQKIVKKAKLTKVAFNRRHPILLVGDDHGCITSVKLSPNLRKKSQSAEEEMEKLNKLMEVALKGEM